MEQLKTEFINLINKLTKEESSHLRVEILDRLGELFNSLLDLNALDVDQKYLEMYFDNTAVIPFGRGFSRASKIDKFQKLYPVLYKIYEFKITK